MLVREYAIATDGLYGMVRSLVQHIGFISTGLAGFYHRAPTFHGGVLDTSPQDSKTES
jgi:hypothetical protein